MVFCYLNSALFADLGKGTGSFREGKMSLVGEKSHASGKIGNVSK